MHSNKLNNIKYIKTSDSKDEKQSGLKLSQIQLLLAKKMANINAFKPNELELKSHISKHAKWLFQNIYSIPYPTQNPFKECQGIARLHHGIQHVSRAAMYVPILANLYRRWGDRDALNLNQEDIQLLQIAALFHDAAREDEGIDKWDNESALLLYYYLTQVLKVDETKAKLIAEATANKDANKSFVELVKNTQNEWEWKTTKSRPKNIYQKLIHDADCLDIIRVRQYFDANYLDFYQQFASYHPQALDEMAELIIEIRSLVEIQGDRQDTLNLTLKKQYEHENAYEAILTSLQKEHYKVLPKLYAEGNLLDEKELKQSLLPSFSYDSTKSLTEENFNAAVRAGKVLARGVATPSGIRRKYKSKNKNDFKFESSNLKEESLSEVEVRKMLRRLGVPTRTKKPNNKLKHGNPYRSVSLLGWGGTVFANAGYLIVNYDLKSIQGISKTDYGTGRAKKSHLQNSEKKLTDQKKLQELANLMRNQKMGGAGVEFTIEKQKFSSTHSELLYHITSADAIYFTQDPNLYNDVSCLNPYPTHPYSPVLQAIFLQNTYESATQVKLPIFEYSGLHNFVKAKEYKSPDIITMWVEMCSAYISKELNNNNLSIIQAMPLEHIKIISMYGTMHNDFAEYNASADINYEEKMQMEINKAIEAERKKLIEIYENNFISKILDSKSSLLDDNIFNGFITYSKWRSNSEVKNKIASSLSAELKSILSDNDAISPFSKLNNFREDFINKLLSHPLKLEDPGIFGSIRNKLVKMYLLATANDQKDLTLDIQKFAANQLKEAINILPNFEYKSVSTIKNITLFSPNSITSQIHEKLFGLFNYAGTFNIYDTVKSNIAEIIPIVFKQATQETLNQNTWNDYLRLIIFLKKFKSLDSVTELAQKAILSLADKITRNEKNSDSHVISYLKLAYQLGLEHLQIRNVVFKYLQITKSKLTKDSDLFNLIKSVGLLSDKEILNLVLKKMPSNFKLEPLENKTNLRIS